jgi:prepilin-type processing-associated H-X9-DG protein
MICPGDTEKIPARDFSSSTNGGLKYLQSQAVGYFIGLEIAMDEPNAILAGDRNVQGSSNAVCTVAGISATRLMLTATWQNRIHLGGSGNVLFCDGSTRRMNSNDVNQATLKNPVDANKYGCVLIP